MESIRCVIEDISNIMLADIVHRISEQNLNVEFLQNIHDNNLSTLVREHAVDVVVTGFDNKDIPMVCNQLLEEFHDVAIVGLIEDGRRMCIYIDDAGPRELIELIQSAVEEKRKRSYKND